MKREIIYFLFIIIVIQTAMAQTTFHGNIAHTGVYDSPGLKGANSLKWAFKTDGAIAGSPAVADGVVFIGSYDGNFYAVDQKTGQQKWKFETKGQVASSPAIENGIVYFGSYDGNFYALDAATGKEKWKFAMEYERRFQAKHIHQNEPKEQTIPDAWDFFTSSPAIFKGRVYFGSGDKNVYALDAQTGELKWKFATKDVVHASPAVWNNTIYIGSWDSCLYALDADNGKEKWKFKAGEDFVNFNQVGFQSSPTVADGVVYIGCRDSHVYAIDALTGNKKWEYSTGNAWVSNTPAVRDGVVYVGTNPFNALDAKTGKLLYSFSGGAGVFSSPALAGDFAYFGGLIGNFFAVDTKSGKLVWEFKTDGAKKDVLKVIGGDGKWNPAAFSSVFNDFQDDYIIMSKRFSAGAVLSSPVVDGGEIYFGSTDGNLYALHSDAQATTCKENTFEPDLTKISDGKVWQIDNRSVGLSDAGNKKSVRFDERKGVGIAWLKDFQFQNGTIEFDVKGKNVLQKSFVGAAFQAKDDEAEPYDIVYFRPFNFKSEDSERHSHAVQYISSPDFSWQRLRAESPLKYEQPVNPAPDPDGWFHARITVDGTTIKVFVNNVEQPNLIVEKLSSSKSGKIGLWVGDNSDGEFANLKITSCK